NQQFIRHLLFIYGIARPLPRRDFWFERGPAGATPQSSRVTKPRSTQAGSRSLLLPPPRTRRTCDVDRCCRSLIGPVGLHLHSRKEEAVPILKQVGGGLENDLRIGACGGAQVAGEHETSTG